MIGKVPTNEAKYQAIRLYNSGFISLTELKASLRMVAVVASEEYSSPGDQKDVLRTKDRLDRLTRLSMTRDAAKQEAILKLKPKSKLTSTRAEEIAKLATGYKGSLPHNWARYGILRKKTKRVNEPRPGSSKGKIAPRTRYIGFKEFNRDYDLFEKAILQLLRTRKAGKTVARELGKVRKAVRVSATRMN